MDISASTYGGFILIWLVLAIPTVVSLAERKTETRGLTIFWGSVAALFPPLGLLFILALLIKPDRS